MTGFNCKRLDNSSDVCGPINRHHSLRTDIFGMGPGTYVNAHEQANFHVIEFVTASAADMPKDLWNIGKFDMAEFSCHAFVETLRPISYREFLYAWYGYDSVSGVQE